MDQVSPSMGMISKHLGEKLVLPPFLEDRRVEIEKNLKPIEEVIN